MKTLRRDAAATAKDRLTVDWFSKTVGELRSEIAELQQATKNTTRAVQQRDPLHEDVAELQYDQRQMRLAMDALRSRQEQLAHEVQELRAEALQNSEDIHARLHRLHDEHNKQNEKVSECVEKKAEGASLKAICLGGIILLLTAYDVKVVVIKNATQMRCSQHCR